MGGLGAGAVLGGLLAVLLLYSFSFLLSLGLLCKKREGGKGSQEGGESIESRRPGSLKAVMVLR